MATKTKTGNRLPKPYKIEIPSLNSGWHDKDEVLLHVCLQLLVDFMEKEKPGETIEWSHDAEHRRVWKELNALYKWWTVTRPARKDLDFEKFSTLLDTIPKQDRLDVICNKIVHTKRDQLSKLSAKSADRERKWHDEDQKYLHRLIDVRPYLWT